MDLPLLLMMIALFQEALPGLSPEDSEVVRHLELLENMELAESMELFVAPVDEPDAGLPEAPESAP